MHVEALQVFTSPLASLAVTGLAIVSSVALFSLVVIIVLNTGTAWHQSRDLGDAAEYTEA